MRHKIAGRRLNRTTEHRISMMRNMSTSLFRHERIKTTLPKAKELRSFAEKLITISRKESLHARRQVMRHIHDKEVVAKLFDTLSARYASRPGGYTRIIKIGPRRGDDAEMAYIELVGAEVVVSEKTESSDE
jgi:large subunit ribosomal protein L17